MDRNGTKPFNKAEFKELGRVSISGTVTLVVSEIHKNGILQGYNINRHIITDGYDGFVKGQEVPAVHLTEFLKLFPQENLIAALA